MIATIIIGALCGWLASMVMKTDAQQGAFLNIIIGIVGAVVAKYLFGNVLGFGGAQNAAHSLFSFWDILWGVLGSVVVIGILKAVGLLR